MNRSQITPAGLSSLRPFPFTRLVSNVPTPREQSQGYHRGGAWGQLTRVNTRKILCFRYEHSQAEAPVPSALPQALRAPPPGDGGPGEGLGPARDGHVPTDVDDRIPLDGASGEIGS